MSKTVIARVEVTADQPLLVPTKETLGAIKRLNAGQGVEMSLNDFTRQLIKIFPQAKEELLKNLALDKQISEMTGAAMPSSGDRHTVIQDARFERKLTLLQKLSLTPAEIATYDRCVRVLALGGTLKSRFHDHPLDKKGTQDLRGFRSFLIRKHPDYKKRVICLYLRKSGILRLANVGKRDAVYRYGALDDDTKII